MIYFRKIQEKLKKYIKSDEIIILTGMRRVGKTTLYRSIFDSIKSENKIFLDLDNPVTQKIFEEMNYDNIVENLANIGIERNKKAYIFLDEIQSMPEISKVVKYLYDHYGFKFFLTGSSSYYLKNLFPESLAGRKYVFELFPLDFEEFLIFKDQKINFYSRFSDKDKNKNPIRYQKIKKYHDEYLRYGGFPAVVLEKDPKQKALKLEDVFKSYFEKDVKNLARFREIKVFRDLILLLMSRVGSMIDVSRLSAELGVSRETIYSYVSFLESTYFINLLGPFTKNIDKEVAKGKKVYFCDNGILNTFSKISDGALLENAVFNCIKQNNKIQYYRKTSGKEIDFIINQKTCLEVKNKGIDQDLNNLKNIMKEVKIKEGYVISKGYVAKKGFISVVDL